MEVLSRYFETNYEVHQHMPSYTSRAVPSMRDLNCQWTQEYYCHARHVPVLGIDILSNLSIIPIIAYAGYEEHLV